MFAHNIISLFARFLSDCNKKMINLETLNPNGTKIRGAYWICINLLKDLLQK